RDHQPVEGRRDSRAFDLLVEQRDLRIGLLHLCLDNLGGRALSLGQGLAVFGAMLATLGVPLQSFDDEIFVVEGGYDLAGMHQVAGAHELRSNISVERSYE